MEFSVDKKDRLKSILNYIKDCIYISEDGREITEILLLLSSTQTVMKLFRLIELKVHILN